MEDGVVLTDAHAIKPNRPATNRKRGETV